MQSLINEKGLCKVLKAALKAGGYEFIPGVEDAELNPKRTIIINGATWAVKCPVHLLPKDAAVLVVQDVGYLPMEPMEVMKNGSNQAMLPELAEKRNGLLPGVGKDTVPMKKIPVIYRDRWQLYQTGTGDVYAFDVELLKLIDFKTVGGSEDFKTYMTESGALGIFDWKDWTIYIAPGRFSGADLEKIHHIAGLDWENQIEQGDPVVNVSLFDATEDVAPIEKEE